MGRASRLRTVDSDYTETYRTMPQRHTFSIVAVVVVVPVTILMIILTILIKIYAEYLFKVAFMVTAFTLGIGALSVPAWLFIALRRYATKAIDIPIGANGTILSYQGKQLHIISANEVFAVETEQQERPARIALPFPGTHQYTVDAGTTQPLVLPEAPEPIKLIPDLPMRVLDTLKVEEALQESATQDAVVKLKATKAKRDAQVLKLQKFVQAGLSHSVAKTMLGIKSEDEYIDLCHEAGVSI